jgi:hypothetical protein
VKATSFWTFVARPSAFGVPAGGAGLNRNRGDRGQTGRFSIMFCEFCVAATIFSESGYVPTVPNFPHADPLYRASCMVHTAIQVIH